MKTVMQTLGLVALTAIGTLAIACSAPQVEVTAAPSTPRRAGNKEIFRSSVVAKEAKITAPVQLVFTAAPSAPSATGAAPVVLTLTVRAQTDIPSGVARFVLPSGVTLISGQQEVEFGTLQKGIERQFTLTVAAPASGQSQIFAGVDCHISSGIQLHKEASPLLVGRQTGAPN